MGEFQEYIYTLSDTLSKNKRNYTLDNILVSIIVPVYNAENHITQCLNSLIHQSFESIEIILVNDGSTDNSLSIISTYAQFDNRIKIINQTNQKQGAARNRGLEIAKGEYILFVDADDYIDTDYIEKMYSTAKNSNVDFAISSIIRKKDNKYKKQLCFNQELVIVAKASIIDTIQLPPYWYVCGKLFKKEILNNLKFEENVYYEDVGFLIQIIAKTESIVTVPDVNYYYVSNSNSTMKSKQTLAKKQDKINALINAIEYAKFNNIPLKEFPLLKKNICGLSIKYYINKINYKFLGIKIYTKKKDFQKDKTFLVFNTACFGDVLLCNSLCQNIKLIYPDSKIIFIVDKPFYDAAKLQKDVDEVIIYDKKGHHKGFLGIFKFIKNFKYKNIFCAFITYKNYRNYLISKLLNSKITLMNAKKDNITKMQEQHATLLKHLTHKKIKNLPIKCILNNSNLSIFNEYKLDTQKYIVISPLTKKLEKDIPIQTTKELIRELNHKGYKVVLSGVGLKALEYSKKLDGEEFINLINQTSIPELATILLHSKCLISADTGTMHLGCALNVPIIAVFYENSTISKWAPSPDLYKIKLLNQDQSSNNIIKNLEELTC